MPKTVWVGDDHANLHQRTIEELVEIYPEYNRNAIRAIRNHHIKKGCTVERQQPYEGTEKERQRRKALGNMVLTTLEVPIEHLVYHQRLQEGLNEHGTVTSARFEESSHTGYIKNKDNEIEYTEPLERRLTRFDIKFDSDPLWPPVTKVESVTLRKREFLKNPERGHRTFLMGDLQYPYVDYKALSVALQIAQDAKPDTIFLGGDVLDLTEWSKYQQRPEFATATQDALVKVHRLFVILRKMFPRAEIIYQEANHEKRLPDYLLQNAKAAFNLRKADEPESWPLMSIPYMLSLDSLDVQYLGGFPSNFKWLSDDLQIKHRAKGRGPLSVARNERYSTIYFDNHRIESQYQTYNTSDGPRTYGVFGIGALCLLDGTPGQNVAYDPRGERTTVAENWQQSVGIADVASDGTTRVDNNILIDTFNGHRTSYNNKVYYPDQKLIELLSA